MISSFFRRSSKGGSTFQTILMVVFGAAIVGALILFAVSHGSSSTSLQPITLWGTVSQSDFNAAMLAYNQAGGTKLPITYVEQQPAGFNQNLIEALADGNGPDAVILPQDMILQFKDKIFPIPYTSFSALSFQQMFVDEASLYTGPNGITAFPLSVDPLVMYWNKDILNSGGLTLPPSTWDKFFNFSTKFTERDSVGNITQSAVALGGYPNITNAKDIVSVLLMQSGTPIVSLTGQANPAYQSVLASRLNYPTPPAETALTFYTEFSNPAKPDYSWNNAISDSLDDFAEGNLAVYFGFASDYKLIQEKNPNINFAVSALPQPLGAKTKLTFGQMDGIAVLKGSKNISNAFKVVSALFSSSFPASLVSVEGIAPARLDLLSMPQTSNANTQLFYNSAIISRGWLDPNTTDSDDIFKQMVDNITSGADEISVAVQGASDQLDLLLAPIPQ